MLYKAKEVAEILKVNLNYVYDLIQKGILPGIKLGSWKVPAEAIPKFINDYIGYDLTDLDNIKKSDYIITNVTEDESSEDIINADIPTMPLQI